MLKVVGKGGKELLRSRQQFCSLCARTCRVCTSDITMVSASDVDRPTQEPFMAEFEAITVML